jgi:hypothetical protein
VSEGLGVPHLRYDGSYRVWAEHGVRLRIRLDRRCAGDPGRGGAAASSCSWRVRWCWEGGNAAAFLTRYAAAVGVRCGKMLSTPELPSTQGFEVLRCRLLERPGQALISLTGRLLR